MSACLLLDQFELCIEISVVFGLSIYTVTANSCDIEYENVLFEFFWNWVVEGSNKNVVL